MVNILFDMIIYMIFGIILLWQLKVNITDDSEEMCKRLNALRGVFALKIIVGHVVRYEDGLLYPLGKFMIISVAFFFFVSAFGMFLPFKKRKKIFI